MPPRHPFYVPSLTWRDMSQTAHGGNGDQGRFDREEPEARGDKIRRRIREHGEAYGDHLWMNIPRDKGYPERGVGQCDECGGHGCLVCHNTGWLSDNHPKVRRCLNPSCDKVLPPFWEAVYCPTSCALDDA